MAGLILTEWGGSGQLSVLISTPGWAGQNQDIEKPGPKGIGSGPVDDMRRLKGEAMITRHAKIIAYTLWAIVCLIAIILLCVGILTLINSAAGG